MNQIISVYTQLLDKFPPSLHPVVSIIVALLIIYAIIRIVQKDFIFIILLVVLLPASVPILMNIFNFVVALVKFLLAR
jgi:hypothetical protein